MKVVLTILLIIVLRSVLDVLFLGKIDAFNRANKPYYLTTSFLESAYSIAVIGFVISLMDSSFWYVLAYGGGAILGGLISAKIKAKLDNKLEGQRKFFTRITIDDEVDPKPLIEALKEHNFDFMVKKEQYINGNFRTVIEGSLEDRQRMWELKDVLRGRKGKHVVIIRAEDVYMIR